MKLRRLNATGIGRLGTFLDSLTTGAPESRPDWVLTDPATSDEVSPPIEIDQRTFGNRFEAARYLDERFTAAGLTGIRHDKGLWAWLAFFYFDELCPPDKRGQRKPGE